METMAQPLPSQAAQSTAPAVELTGISKRYGATRALDDVSVSIPAGQTHGLVGRNGAGKSTLVRIITGMETADTGSVRFFGEAAPPASAVSEWQDIVACVYQRPSLFANLTVAENMFINRYPAGVARSISWSQMNRSADNVLQEWGIDVSPKSILEDVPIEQRQMVQIARALDSGSRIVLLDEPTVQLDGGATARLFAKLEELKQRGVTFVLVSHFLKEIEEACDGATVLRDGKLLWSRAASKITQDELVEAVLAGQEKKIFRIGKASATESLVPPRLELASVSDSRGAFTDISLTIAPGELVAIAGLGGSGKYDLGEAIVGLRKLVGGTVSVDGEPSTGTSAFDALKNGIGYVPADRHADGYIPQLSVEENMTMSVMDHISTLGFFSPKKRRELSRGLIEDVSLVPPNPQLEVTGLSGGNQQKVVLARALARNPKLLVLISPTAGVDIAAKNTIYELIGQALERNVSVLLISDEIEEILISSRVLVMTKGRFVADLHEPTEEEVIRAIEGMETK
jgi:simple sugar transport system ATP-binding protein